MFRFLILLKKIIDLLFTFTLLKPFKLIFFNFIYRKIFLKLYRPYFLIKKSILKGDHKLTSFKYIDGLAILIIFIFIIIYNFNTKYVLAEDLGKKNLLAQVTSTEFEEEIVETITQEEPTPKLTIESPPIESGAVQIKDIPRPTTAEQHINITENTSALVKPNITGAKSTSTRQTITYYEVESGDNIGFIADLFELNQNTILWANQLSKNSLIKPGDKLVILPTDGVYHQVRRGESISVIAQKYKADEEKIIHFNQLADASEIKIGQKLIIPGGKVTYSIPRPSGLSPIKNIFTSPGTISSKGFIWPSGSSRRITQYYHWRHHAVDIGGKRGSNILASKAGRVERAGWTSGYGYNIIIDHGGGVKTLYAHADKLYVKRGDQVSAGQAIGALGSTGWSSGPHIHFEIRIKGKKVNPLSYL